VFAAGYRSETYSIMTMPIL